MILKGYVKLVQSDEKAPYFFGELSEGLKSLRIDYAKPEAMSRECIAVGIETQFGTIGRI